MSYDFDALVIGLGPAGMAVSAMAAEMGLKVCAVEKAHVGGECMNVGCIPSKAILRMGKKKALFQRLSPDGSITPVMPDPFGKIATSLAYISKNKTMGMLNKVEMIYQQGDARFTGPHEVQVGGRTLTARCIYICTGTRPAVPNVPGLHEVQPLTNENLFHLDSVPQSLMVLGSGAIACEMAQAFARMGSKVSMVFRGKGVMWREDNEATSLLQEALEKDGVTLYPNADMERFSRDAEGVHLHLKDGTNITAEHVLCALGRQFDAAPLNLDAAGVAYTNKGITVDDYLRTSQRHIYACGDVNGHYKFSHAAMHQGMLAVMNSMLPWPFKRAFKKYPVPWTIFTEPQISRVGKTATQLDKEGVKYETIKVNYADYGAAIAEDVDTGFVKVMATPAGKVLGGIIVGEGSGEMINEWTTIIQQRINLIKVMMQQHSFPTMGFLSKRVAEIWMMRKMGSSLVRKVCRLMFNAMR